MVLFQKNLIQELHGQIVNQSKKLEINQTVDHVGHLVLLKLCLIESVLLQNKPYKQD